jgi:hypothetical protein
MRRAWFLYVVPVILVFALAAQKPVRPVPLKVGEKIPDFHAADQYGKDRRFSDLVGPKGLVLFFYKSADW